MQYEGEDENVDVGGLEEEMVDIDIVWYHNGIPPLYCAGLICELHVYSFGFYNYHCFVVPKDLDNSIAIIMAALIVLTWGCRGHTSFTYITLCLVHMGEHIGAGRSLVPRIAILPLYNAVDAVVI